MANKTRLLKIEAQRAQTFLFKVPRLADMDGANALLGDLFRQRLPKALSDYLSKPTIDTETIKALETIEQEFAASDPMVNRNSEPNNSIGCSVQSPFSAQDRPSQLFAEGLLVRDGGRLWALVDEDDVEAAKLAAAASIQDRCPGLGYAFHVTDLDEEKHNQEIPTSNATDLVGLPCFRWAEDGGDEPAAGTIEFKREGGREDTRSVARSTLIKREARRKRDGLWDVASLLRPNLPGSSDNTDTVDFKDIAAGRYLAVIHMDGNSIGARSMRYASETSENEFIAKQARMEKFFFAMRSATRQSVAAGLNNEFRDYPDQYRLLMLGGDDVLIVCRADKALPFVCSVAHELTAFELPDGEPLTLGAGIAIAKPNLPFHRLHQLAEQLASSAKRIGIDPDGKRRSVVDWLVTTSSWVDSVEAHRGRWERVKYTIDQEEVSLVLTGKPYPVLTQNDEPSLEALLKSAQEVRTKFYCEGESGNGVRSQLKNFLNELHKGKIFAELAWAGLPHRLREFLDDRIPANFQKPGVEGKGLWMSVKANGGNYRTWLPDLIEAIELQQIGSQRASEADELPESQPKQRGQGSAT